MPTLYDTLNSSYGNKQSMNKLKNEGYNLDTMLSNTNNQVWVNPNKNKLILGIKGTNSINDIGTDVYLGFGKLDKTDRFKESKSILNYAKQKYNGYDTTVTGHSLGATIGSKITNKNDKFIGFNEGIAPFQTTRSYNGNHQHFRTGEDTVSILGSNATHMREIKNETKTGILPFDILTSHSINTIKKSNIIL
jgi:hypothetical protein